MQMIYVILRVDFGGNDVTASILIFVNDGVSGYVCVCMLICVYIPEMTSPEVLLLTQPC